MWDGQTMQETAIPNTSACIASQKIERYWTRRGFSIDLCLAIAASAEWLHRPVFYADGSCNRSTKEILRRFLKNLLAQSFQGIETFQSLDPRGLPVLLNLQESAKISLELLKYRGLFLWVF